MFTWNFLRQTVERATKVFAESLAALLLASNAGLLVLRNRFAFTSCCWPVAS
jgi:hypothetical protein